MWNFLKILMILRFSILTELNPKNADFKTKRKLSLNATNKTNNIMQRIPNLDYMSEIKKLKIIMNILNNLENMPEADLNELAKKTIYISHIDDLKNPETHEIILLNIKSNDSFANVIFVHKILKISNEPFENSNYFTNKFAFYALTECKLIKFFSLQLESIEKDLDNRKLLSYMLFNLQKNTEKFVYYIDKNTKLLNDQFDKKLFFKSFDYVNFEKYKNNIPSSFLDWKNSDHYTCKIEAIFVNVTEIFILKLIAFDFLNFVQTEMNSRLIDENTRDDINPIYHKKYEYCENINASERMFCVIFCYKFDEIGIENTLNCLKIIEFTKISNYDCNWCLHIEININLNRQILNLFKETLNIYFSIPNKKFEDIYFFMKILEKVFLYSCLINTSNINTLENLKEKKSNFIS